MKNTKIPTSIIVFLLLLVGFVALFVTLIMPTINDIPKFQTSHDEAVRTIAQYDSVNGNYDAEQEKVNNLTKQYDEKQAELYVDATSSIEDLQDIFTKLGIKLTTLTRSEGMRDSKGRTSTGGIPLYTTNLSFAFENSLDTTQKLIHYLEQTSKGCYFINSLNMSPVDGSNNYSVSFDVTIYYFDSSQGVQVATEAPTTK